MKINTLLGETIYPILPISHGSDFISGYAFKGSDFIDSGNPVIKIKNIQNKKVTTENSQYISEDVITENIIKYKLNNGDVLIAMTGQGSVGRVGKLYINEDETPYLNQRVGKFVADEELLNIDFLYYIISTNSYEKYLFAAGSGSGQPNLSPAIIKSIEIPYPPYETQRRIARILKEYDDKIEINNQINQTLEQMAQAIFKSWFVDFEPVKAKIAALEVGGSEDDALLAAMQAIAGSALFATDTDAQTQLARLQAEHPEQYTTLRATAELFPSAMQESELGEIPEGWVVSQIGDEVTVVGGGTPSTKNPEFWEGGTINWTTPKDLSNQVDKMLIDTDRRITQAGLNRISSGLLPVDTVLMSSRAPVGYLALAKTPIAVNQGYIAMKCEQTLSPEFVIQWCEVNMAEIKNRASGTTFAEISKKSFNIIPVLVPQESLISVYSKHIHQLYLKIEMSVRENKTLAELRDTLLPKLLSGELSISSAFTGQESCT